MSTVCLAVMVKNESAILERLLESVAPYIDCAVLQDTGSTDNTIEVFEKYLADKGIPYSVYLEEWTDFAWNRTKLIHQAQLKDCDYLLLLDADHVLDVPDSSAFDDLTADSYLLSLSDGSMEYFMPYLVKSSCPWRYLSPTHEYLTCDLPFLQEKHPILSVLHYCDGGTRPEKFDRDRMLLERAYETDPLNDRTTFYLAQTYGDIGDADGARRLYEECAAVSQWDEQTYICYLRIARITQSIDDYLRAWNFRPSRSEALSSLIRQCNERGLYQAARAFANAAPLKPSSDVLFVERSEEKWGLPLEAGIAAWWTGYKEEAGYAFREILRIPDLPTSYRDLCVNNLKHCEPV